MMLLVWLLKNKNIWYQQKLSKDIHNTLHIKVSLGTVSPEENLIFFQISIKILTTGNIK